MMQQHWKIDKRIPISVLGMLFIQLVTVIAWASYLEARVSQTENTLNQMGNISEKLGRIEERVNSVKEEIMILSDSLKHRG